MSNEHNEICAGKVAFQKLLLFVVRIVAAFGASLACYTLCKFHLPVSNIKMIRAQAFTTIMN